MFGRKNYVYIKTISEKDKGEHHYRRSYNTEALEGKLLFITYYLYIFYSIIIYNSLLIMEALEGHYHLKFIIQNLILNI
jgi:hypothetical protein